MTNLDDTQPKRPANFPPQQDPYIDYDDGIPAPPRFLLFGMIGLFMLGIIGVLSGIVVFREVLNQGQQQRVVNSFPFMEVFQETVPTPEGGIVQRAGDVDENAANALLDLSVGGGNDAAAPPPPIEMTPEVTEEEPTVAEVTTEPPTVTPTTTPTPTVVTPAVEPTEEVSSAAVPPEAAPLEVTEEVSAAAVPQNDTPPESALINPAPQTTSWSGRAFNTGFVDYRQTWNNCGPASISIALSYYGWRRDMEFAESYLRPNSDDKNVSPQEMVDFVNERADINALWRMGGNLDLLRVLIDNEFPVVIERGQRFEGTDWLGHYQTIVGYDDNQRLFFAYDSFLDFNENGVPQTYDEINRHWREFNYIFIVLYEPTREDRLMELLGPWADPAEAAQVAFETAQEQALQDQTDPFAWLNMGTSLTAVGDHQRAQHAYDWAIDNDLPWRIFWYQHSIYETLYEVGRYEDVLSYTATTIELSQDNVEEARYWQGRALAALGRTQEARASFNRAVNFNQYFDAAREALESL